ncbi:hypothetical protein WJX72_001943 [[Myrmecia] bisecta]|uniref:Uncharacterized protein n=1 Tax=[Myrmecia] bisecta TaxID=41462 RepID=A0AAW1R589_9CHLO
MPEPEVYRKAVAENRMVTVKEAKYRKAVGLISGLCTGLYVAAKGVKVANPAGVAFGSALSSTVLWSGIQSQCGCSMRLRWVVNGPAKREWTPQAYQPFMRKKRREFITNALVSGVLGLAVGTAVGITGGKTRDAAAISAAKGTAIELALMFGASLVT